MSTQKSTPELELIKLAKEIKADGIDIRIQSVKFLLNHFLHSKDFKKNTASLNAVSTAIDIIDELGQLKSITNEL